MRSILFALVLLALPFGADAQSRLLLEATHLHAGGTRYALSGTPLAAERFEGLRLSVPGQGDFLVLDRPFAGARQAGSFEPGGLFFVAEGVSVRVPSASPMLPETPERPAYVRMAGPPPPERSLVARAALAELAPADTPVEASRPRPDAPLDEARLAQLTAERDRLLERLGEVQDEIVALLTSRPETPPASRTAAQTAAPGPTFEVPDARRLRDPEAAARALRALNRAAAVRAPYTADVLIVSDASGRTETAVVVRRQDARVDALVEDFARRLHFEPPVVDGLPAVVRSQVRVRLVPEP